MEEKKNKRKLTGVVIKLSSEKTIKVRVERKYPHPKYGKIVKEHRNYLVHNGNNTEVNLNDEVEIQECRPVSKMKSWELVKVITK